MRHRGLRRADPAGRDVLLEELVQLCLLNRGQRIEFPVRGLPVARELYRMVPFPVVRKGVEGLFCKDILEIPEHGRKEFMKCFLLFRVVLGMPFRNPLRHSACRADFFHGSVAISRCKDSVSFVQLRNIRSCRPLEELVLSFRFRGESLASSLMDSGRLGRDFLSKSRNDRKDTL